MTREVDTVAEIEPTNEDFAAVGAAVDAAERYRLAQANAMLRLFREAHGRDAATTDELTEWLQHRP